MHSVSIAMCTYNGSAYIKKQLESIGRQTLQPLELVICDDGSTDETESIIEDFSGQVSFPVRYMKNEVQLGYRENFMNAAAKCTGDIVAFCDQDDVWMPDKLERCVHQFEDQDVLFVYHEINIINGDGIHISRYSDRAPPSNTMEPMTMTPWLYAYGFTQLMRRNLCSYNAFWKLSSDQNDPKQHLAHDQYYMFLSSVLGRISYIQEPLADYRQHGKNLFGVKDTSEKGSSMHQRLAIKSDEFRRCSLSAASRSSVLREVSAASDGKIANRSVRGRDLYENLSSLYALRASLYQDKSRMRKLSLVGQIMRKGGYQDNRPWSFGRKAFLKDLAISAL